MPRVTRSKVASSPQKANNPKVNGGEASAPVLESDDTESFHSDALDDDEISTSRKRKQPSRKKSKSSPKKIKTTENDEDEDDFELKEGQEIVGVVVKAPVHGRVPPGQISQNTFNFLNDLKDPECNDREWFKLHEPVYRLAEQEWKDFVTEFTNLLVEIDTQIPPLPSKDVIHRIYRDIRFSGDKTPYKKNMTASFSRTGRKGHFAHYHISIEPGGGSIIAAGSWCPGKDNLAIIRSNIQHDSRPLRDVISAPEFVRHFGEAKPHPKGLRQNIFGFEDELKVAPKGIDKNHADIDLLKCRSFCVVHKFTDEQVLAPDFKEELARLAALTRPFVHCMNNMMTLRNNDDDED